MLGCSLAPASRFAFFPDACFARQRTPLASSLLRAPQRMPAGKRAAPPARTLRRSRLRNERRACGRALASLQKQLSSASSAEDVLELAASSLHSFDSIHLATALHRSASLRADPSDTRLGALRARVDSSLPKQDAHGVSNALWSFASLGLALPEPSTLEHALCILRSNAHSCKPQAVCNSLWALGTLQRESLARLTRNSWFALHGILEEGASRCRSLSGQELSNLLWGSGRIGLRPREVCVAALLRRAHDLADSQLLEPQEAGMILWSLATLYSHDSSVRQTSAEGEELRRITVAFAHSVRDTLDLQASAIAAWAFGSLQLHPGEALLSAIAERYVREGAGADPVATANVLWGFSRLGVSPGDAVLDLGERRVQKKLHFTGVREITALLEAFSELGCEPSDEFLEDACRQLEEQTHTMKLDDYFETLRALPRFGVEVSGRILQGAYERIETIGASSEAVSGGELRQAINAMMQLASHGFNLFSDATLSKLFDEAEREGAALGIGYASGLVQTMAASEAGVLPHVSERSNTRLRCFVQCFAVEDWDCLSLTESVRMLRALSSLRAYPGTPQLDRLCERAVAAEHAHLGPESLTMLLRAMAGLLYSPRESCMVTLAARSMQLAEAGQLRERERQALVRALWMMGSPMQLWRKLEGSADERAAGSASRRKAGVPGAV